MNSVKQDGTLKIDKKKSIITKISNLNIDQLVSSFEVRRRSLHCSYDCKVESCVLKNILYS